jgi:hypothetical protein
MTTTTLTIPARIVEILTPLPGETVVRSAADILAAINTSEAFKDEPLTIKRLRPRLSEMKRLNIIEKVEGGSTNGARNIAAWKLKGLDP